MPKEKSKKKKNKEYQYLEKLKTYSPVKSEKDYWKKHKTFKKAIGGIYRNLKRFIQDPRNMIDTYDSILKEGVRIKLITPEFRREKLKQLVDELSKPTEFKRKAGEKITKAKNKFKKKFLNKNKNKNKKKSKKSKKELEKKKKENIKVLKKEINNRIKSNENKKDQEKD